MDIGAEHPLFWRRFFMKTDRLPRQALDKQGGNSKMRYFPQGSLLVENLCLVVEDSGGDDDDALLRTETSPRERQLKVQCEEARALAALAEARALAAEARVADVAVLPELESRRTIGAASIAESTAPGGLRQTRSNEPGHWDVMISCKPPRCSHRPVHCELSIAVLLLYDCMCRHAAQCRVGVARSSSVWRA